MKTVRLSDKRYGTLPQSLLESVQEKAHKFSVSELEAKVYKLKSHSVQGETPRFVQMNSASWSQLLALGFPKSVVDAHILDYCRKNEYLRAFVFFSLDEGLIRRIVEYLMGVPAFEIVFISNYELSKQGQMNFIELCYGDKSFFNERTQRKMTRERFGFSSSAVVLLFQSQPGHLDTKDLKARLRRLLPSTTFERRIHGTDGPEDTFSVLEVVTNINSLDLLNRAKISRNHKLFSRIPEFAKNSPDVCVDGSAVMELYGLRKSRDLDFICASVEKSKIVQGLGFDVRHYQGLPISANQVVVDPSLHLTLFGYKFSSLLVRHFILGVSPKSESKTLASKNQRDFRLISSFYSAAKRSKLGLASKVSTLFTQLRILSDFVIIKLVPLLPRPVVGVLRSLRKVLTKK